MNKVLLAAICIFIFVIVVFIEGQVYSAGTLPYLKVCTIEVLLVIIGFLAGSEYRKYKIKLDSGG